MYETDIQCRYFMLYAICEYEINKSELMEEIYYEYRVLAMWSFGYSICDYRSVICTI